MGKCPNCGAPMQANVCSYCQYTEPSSSVKSEATKRNYNVEVEKISDAILKKMATFRDGIESKSNISEIHFVERKSRCNRFIALLLCLFLGYFGVHNFYVGRYFRGIIYLFTGGLFGIGWFIDIILIAVGSFKDSDGLIL